MRTEMKIESLRPLVIGHETDNLTGLVEIDCSTWMKAYPMLNKFALAVTPPEGNCYIAVTEMEGTMLRWVVSRADTASAGEGSYQIIATGENDESKLTDHYSLYIYANMPGLDGAAEPPDPARPWVNEVLQAAENAEKAADEAKEQADRAADIVENFKPEGGGNGEPGEDGGYYIPSVSDAGDLTWNPSKEDMPAVPTANIKGPKGDPGEPGEKGEPGEPGSPGADGKTAYEYAREGGYSGTEAEFVAKLAQEIPEAYTLPTASATVKGGVKVGKGLVMEGDALGVVPEGEYELIETITLEEEMTIIRTAELDGTPYNLDAISVHIVVPADTTITNGSVVFYKVGEFGTNQWFLHRWMARTTRSEQGILDLWVANNRGQYIYHMPSEWDKDGGSPLMRGESRLSPNQLDANKPIGKLEITMVLPAKTVITIKGVRANA